MSRENAYPLKTGHNSREEYHGSLVEMRKDLRFCEREKEKYGAKDASTFQIKNYGTSILYGILFFWWKKAAAGNG